MVLFKNRDFRLLMFSQGISNMGDWLIIGILLVVIGKLSGKTPSALAISGLWIAKMLPIMFSPIVGALVDNIDRKKGMIYSDLIRGLLIASIPFLLRFDNLLLIYAVIFFSEIFTLFFVPAKDASIPNIVKKNELLDANSVSFSINQITMFAGLALGTTIILTVNKIFENLPLLKQFAGTYSAIYFDALTFFVSAILLAFIAFPKKENKVGADYKKFVKDITESFKYLMINKKIRGIIISAGFSLVGLGTILVIGPGYADKILGMGKEGFLPLLTVLSLGLLTGAVVVNFLSRYFTRELIFTASLTVIGAAILSLAFIANFAIAFLLSFITGFCLGTLYVSTYTIMHENVTEEIRGRLFTALEADIRLAIIISALFTGFTVEILSKINISIISKIGTDRIILFIGGVIVLIAALFAFKSVAKRMHIIHEEY